jgi:hypothetical protein
MWLSCMQPCIRGCVWIMACKTLEWLIYLQANFLPTIGNYKNEGVKSTQCIGYLLDIASITWPTSTTYYIVGSKKHSSILLPT